MSEYTTVYLRYKNTPLLEYREHPSFEETRNLSKDEIMAAIHEVDEYNDSIRDFEEDLENKQYLYNQFYFAKGILDNKSNAEYYELVYTKC